ncbi:rhodanese-like domain-containing protein [Xanthomonas sp. XNM01]|uniref:rhodanese-like domain-containing protein n=1 Tax=Xanthomonas sp. XNM01 TaxID=2769289 RepID=UPI0017840203|nr:rhodanese-like domain-containing protein [Xanthomonas sp. XNM01]MBD9370645.1 VTT domain-containing protein [Xanthomonas sp. XNM01]
MDALLHLIEHYGLWVVLFAVLADQGGLPVPAVPVLVVAGAMTAQAGEPVWPLLAVAVAASLVADGLWYAAGRRYGSVLLRLMCRLSLSPDSCSGSARGIYARWGAPSLIVAKFIPGFAALATVMAGQMRTGAFRFAFHDGLGALLWAGTAVTLGVVFDDAVGELLLELESLGRIGLGLLLAALAGFIAWKLWQRQRFLRLLRMARISVDELQQRFEDGRTPQVLDVRPAQQRDASGWIPGAVLMAELGTLAFDPEQDVVVYCDCPDEASAAWLARQLHARGFRNVRPLTGGFEAWHARGLPVARMEQAAVARATAIDAR